VGRRYWALGTEPPAVELDKLRFYLLKSSWQHLNRLHEINWHLRLQDPDLAGRVSYVARALEGGAVYQPNIVPPPGGVSEEIANTLCTNQRNRLRVFGYIVLQDVGKPLFLYKSSRELMTVNYQAINGTLSVCP
jgi:hypothetical protein